MVTSHLRRAGACLLTLTLLLAGCRSQSPPPDNSPDTSLILPDTVTSIRPELFDGRDLTSLTCQGGVFDLQIPPEAPREVYCTRITYGGQRLDFEEPLYLCGGNFRTEVFVTGSGTLAVLLTGDGGSDGYFLSKDAVQQFHTADVADGAVFLSPGKDGGLRYQKVMTPCMDLLQAAGYPENVSPDDTYSQEGAAALGADGLTFTVEHTTTVRERLAQFSA